MRTTTSLTLGQAAKATGKNKTTIARAIQDGKISAEKDSDGQYAIEPSELFRHFPFVTPATVAEGVAETGNATMRSTEDAAYATPVTGRDLLIDTLRAQIQSLKEERERERQQMEEERRREREQQQTSLEDLRRRLDASEEERRRKDQQLTALLTDQREKDAQPQPQRRSFLSRLLGGMGRE